MRRISSHLTGIDQGSLTLFSDFKDGGAMWTGSGPRELRRKVEFSERYRSVPAVHVSMSMWDMDQKSNPRADIAAEDITEESFCIVFRTWSDTRIARVRADWIAIGEIGSEDDWDLY